MPSPIKPHLRAVRRDDDTLLGGLARREPGATGALFDRFHGEVNRLIRCLLGADSAHDDLVQETFEAVLKQIHRVDSPAALSGWVRRVTINTVRMELRRRRWKSLFTSTSEGQEPPDCSGMDHGQREASRQVRRALSGLDCESRLLLLLRHVEGYELSEVAEVLDVSLATVKRKLMKAEARFASRYSGEPS